MLLSDWQSERRYSGGAETGDVDGGKPLQLRDGQPLGLGGGQCRHLGGGQRGYLVVGETAMPPVLIAPIWAVLAWPRRRS